MKDIANQYRKYINRINSLFNTNVNIALTITGVFVLLTVFLYNYFFDQMFFGPGDKNILIFGLFCIFIGTMQFLGNVRGSGLQGGFILKNDIYEKQLDNKFQQAFPRINRIWGVKWLIRWMYKEGWWYSGLLLIIIAVSLGFMLNHLGQFMSVDEPKWYITRVPQLGYALLTSNWSLTLINDKPGLLPSALSLAEFSLNYLSQFLIQRPLIQGPSEQMLFFWRLPVVIFNIIMLIIIYSYLRDLLNKDSAIICISFIALNPILIGISQIVNPDATLWSTGFAGFLAFFLYIKTNLRKYIFFSGFFMGLALLSKYVVVILYLVFVLVIVVEYLLDNSLKIGHIFRRMYDFYIMVAISMIVFAIFLPATWVDPTLIFKKTLLSGILVPAYIIIIPGLLLLFFDILVLKGRILHFIRQNNFLYNIMNLLSLGAIIYVGFALLNIFLNYPFFHLNDKICCFNAAELSKMDVLNTSVYATIMTNTPLILLMIFIFFITQYVKGPSFLKSDNFLKINIVYSGIIFVFIYILGAALSNHFTTARYEILLHPIFGIISTIMIVSLIRKEDVLRLATILVILLNAFFVFQSSPFYLQYDNVLNVHNAVITDAWGFGGYELAQKANELPNSTYMHVWADREGFKDFFSGNYNNRNSGDPFKNANIQYLVLTNGGKKILLKSLRMYSNNSSGFPYSLETGNLLLKYHEKTPIFEIQINNNPNNYVRLVKIDENDKTLIPEETILSGSNLLANPGFESGSPTPLNWTLLSQSGNSPILDDISHSGSKSVKISIPGTTNIISGQPQSDMIIAQPLTLYKVSVWGKTQNTGGSNTPAVRVVELDSNKNWIRQTNLPVFSRGTSDWTQKSIEFQTDPDTKYLYVYANIWNGYGDFWIDDVELSLKAAQQ